MLCALYRPSASRSPWHATNVAFWRTSLSSGSDGEDVAVAVVGLGDVAANGANAKSTKGNKISKVASRIDVIPTFVDSNGTGYGVLDEHPDHHETEDLHSSARHVHHESLQTVPPVRTRASGANTITQAYLHGNLLCRAQGGIPSLFGPDLGELGTRRGGGDG
jgi:hypothetical protein